MSKRPALGKGMGALIFNEDDSVKKDDQGGVLTAVITDVYPNPDQPRKHFEPEALQELADSIREKGIIQPIIVEEKDGKYQIIAGERRFRAAGLAGLTAVPVIVREFSETEKLEIALIENIQRENLNPVEEAAAYRDLMERANLNQDEIAEKVGKKRSTIANSLRLLKLPEPVRSSVAEGRLSAGHARAILSLSTEGQMLKLHDRILKEGLSVRAAEQLANPQTADVMKLNTSASRKASSSLADRVPEIEDMQERLIERFGTKVSISGSLSRGKIEIAYFSMDDLERLFDLMCR